LALQLEIQKRGYQVKWFADHAEGKAALNKREHVIDDIEQLVAYQPHIVLVATNEVADFITGIKVQIFHGFNAQKRFSKKNKFSHFNIRGFFDLYCTQGPSTTAYFQQLAEKHGHFRVVETGWPKMDSLFPLPEIKQSNKPKTILIASTFSRRLSLAYKHDVYLEIKRLIETKKFQFLMVLHPKIDTDIKHKWQDLACEHFTFFDTTDLNPIFRQADMLLADTTSAIQEFILQNKPVVAFANNSKPDYLINIDKIADIEPSLTLTDDELAATHAKIEIFIKQLHPYFDGRSSRRVIDASLSFLHSDTSDLKPKPLNLLRKFKARRRLGYFTFKTYNRVKDFLEN
jgi:CDP-glycerol glycerophosphotransferase (TagB/SpsB family)